MRIRMREGARNYRPEVLWDGAMESVLGNGIRSGPLVLKWTDMWAATLEQEQLLQSQA